MRTEGVSIALEGKRHSLDVIARTHALGFFLSKGCTKQHTAHLVSGTVGLCGMLHRRHKTSPDNALPFLFALSTRAACEWSQGWWPGNPSGWKDGHVGLKGLHKDALKNINTYPRPLATRRRAKTKRCGFYFSPICRRLSISFEK